MPESKKIAVTDTKILADGDLLVTFSDTTTILYHAQFLYDVRGHDHNISIVDPFKK